MSDRGEEDALPPMSDWGDEEAFEGIVVMWMLPMTHEAGHIVVSHLRGGHPTGIDILRRERSDIPFEGDIEERERGSKFVKIWLCPNTGLAPPAPADHAIQVLVAGWVAELLFNGVERSTGSDRDRRMAEKKAQTLVENTNSGLSVQEVISEAEEAAEELLRAYEPLVRAVVNLAETRLRMNRQSLETVEFGPISIITSEDLDHILNRGGTGTT